MQGIHQEDTVNQDLITELRKEFGMVHDDFYMVLTDTDMKVKVGEKSCGCCAGLGWNHTQTLSQSVKLKEMIEWLNLTCDDIHNDINNCTWFFTGEWFGASVSNWHSSDLWACEGTFVHVKNPRKYFTFQMFCSNPTRFPSPWRPSSTTLTPSPLAFARWKNRRGMVFSVRKRTSPGHWRTFSPGELHARHLSQPLKWWIWHWTDTQFDTQHCKIRPILWYQGWNWAFSTKHTQDFRFRVI